MAFKSKKYTYIVWKFKFYKFKSIFSLLLRIIQKDLLQHIIYARLNLLARSSSLFSNQRKSKFQTFSAQRGNLSTILKFLTLWLKINKFNEVRFYFWFLKWLPSVLLYIWLVSRLQIYSEWLVSRLLVRVHILTLKAVGFVKFFTKIFSTIFWTFLVFITR